MPKQQTFAGLAWQNKAKQTKRERFLAEMDDHPVGAVVSAHRAALSEGRAALATSKLQN
jgi:hypothetical protein